MSDGKPAAPEAKLSPEEALAAGRTLVQVWMGPGGFPAGALGAARIKAPPSRVWEVVSDVGTYAGRVPMIHRVDLAGDRATVALRFKVSLFSVGFAFVAEVRREEGRVVELFGVSGEPRGIRLRFDLAPAAGGAETALEVRAEFEVMSLGWLATYFLKHHPEIQYGIFPGVAVALVDAMRRGVEGRR
jgi:carbon monoxide dehydrogenase subunit G